MHSDAMAGMMHEGAGKAPPKRVHTMVITRGHGKHEVTHHHTHPGHHPAEAHTVDTPGGNLDNLHDHIEDHMGEPNPGEQDCEDGNCE